MPKDDGMEHQTNLGLYRKETLKVAKDVCGITEVNINIKHKSQIA